MTGLAQKTFFVADEVTLQPIPFVKVIPSEGQPILADLDGSFTVNSSIESFELKYKGYVDSVFIVAQHADSSVLLMHLSSQKLDPITVTPGVNPAHRIVKNVIANRRKNHPIKHDPFKYKSYSKFVLDIDPDYVASIPDDTKDSNLIEIREFTDTMHLFLMESVSERYFQPPLRDQERILAYKISGLSDPRFSTFAKALQSFSFYDTQFEVFGKQYVNPIALGGLNRYIFSLQDTIFNKSDTTYTIYFRPKRGKNFPGVEGYMYVNTNQFAIEKVIAEPYNDSTGISVKIVQEYAFLENRRWFPTKLSTEMDITGLLQAGSDSDEVPRIIGTGYTNIEEVTFDPEKVNWRESSVSLFTDPDANELDEKEWNEHRQTTITDKERQTYQTIDSLAEEININRILNVVDILLEGKVPLGYVNLDLRRLYRYNFFERHRIGLGLETSQKLIKPLTLGGYFAYGTGDNDWKYGGHLHFHLWRKKQMRLELRYQQDVLERGGQVFEANTGAWLSPDSYRNLFISSMERQRLAEIAFRTDIRANLTVRLSQNYQRVQFVDDYRFIPMQGMVLQELDLAESAIDLEWNMFAKYRIMGDKKVPTSLSNPKLRIKAVRGLSGIGNAELDYWRFNASIQQQFNITRILNFQWKVNAAKTIGDVPLYLTQLGDGTRVNWNVSTPGSFETMPRATFYNTSQVSVFTRLRFKAIRLPVDFSKPQFSLHHAWGIGTFENRQLHNFDIQSLDNGFGEFGIILDGIWVQNFSGFGLGVFYNYSPQYSDANWRNNIVPKVSFSFVLD